MKCTHWRVSANGQEEELPNVVIVRIEKGEIVKGTQSGGGGYGDPLEREPARVLDDGREHYETPERAQEIYGVVFTGAAADDTLAVDEAATAQRRAEMASA